MTVSRGCSGTVRCEILLRTDERQLLVRGIAMQHLANALNPSTHCGIYLFYSRERITQFSPSGCTDSVSFLRANKTIACG